MRTFYPWTAARSRRLLRPRDRAHRVWHRGCRSPRALPSPARCAAWHLAMSGRPTRTSANTESPRRGRYDDIFGTPRRVKSSRVCQFRAMPAPGESKAYGLVCALRSHIRETRGPFSRSPFDWDSRSLSTPRVGGSCQDCFCVTHPQLLEISAWPWLERLSRRENRLVTLANVSAREWDRHRRARVHARLHDGRVETKPARSRAGVERSLAPRRIRSRASWMDAVRRRRIAVLHPVLRARSTHGRVGRGRHCTSEPEWARPRAGTRLRAQPYGVRSSVDERASRSLRARYRRRRAARAG